MPLLIVAALVIAIGTYLTQRSDGASGGGSGPSVGGDLHAVGEAGDRLLVGGQGGAGHRDPAGGHEGLYASTDGGRSWAAMGGGTGSMSVAVGDGGRSLFVISMGHAKVSTDAGATWTSATIPEDTSAAFYTAEGKLVVGVLDGDRATVYELVGSEWSRLA